jgi:hypothetical protein
MMKRRHLMAFALAGGLFLAFVRLLTTQAPTQAEPRSDSLDVMPVKLGAKKVAFQLNTFLPQVHLTLISVLQGVALGVLIAQFEAVSPFSLPGAFLYVDSLITISYGKTHVQKVYGKSAFLRLCLDWAARRWAAVSTATAHCASSSWRTVSRSWRKR